MNHPELLRAALLAVATLGAGSVLAQTGPGTTTPATPALSTPVVSDAAPPPPEDRASPGAIVMHDSPVRAQRDSMSTRAMGAGPRFQSLTRRAERATARRNTQSDLEQMRMDRAADQRRGGAALDAD